MKTYTSVKYDTDWCFLIKRFRNEFRNVLKLMTLRINEHTHLHFVYAT